MAFVVAIAADDTAPLFLLITDIDLGRGFGEGEIAGAQAEHDVVALEIGLEKGFERVFEMPQMDAAVDHEAFDLMKHRRVRRVAVAGLDEAGRDDAAWLSGIAWGRGGRGRYVV